MEQETQALNSVLIEGVVVERWVEVDKTSTLRVRNVRGDAAVDVTANLPEHLVMKACDADPGRNVRVVGKLVTAPLGRIAVAAEHVEIRPGWTKIGNEV